MQTDVDGSTTSLGIRVVYPEKDAHSITTAYPNPFSDNITVIISLDNVDAIQQAYFINTIGESFYVSFERKSNELLFHTATLPSGVYSLMLQHSSGVQYFKMVKN